ncbi:HpcH/HpaI aldolase/citrate lyase family protein [Tardiphaga sp. 215_C5_N2_1]|uniref:HpcH/HpaI aldolase/citrate lyase family protein n=1 Tax=Tardiphaga sp. 215_C5_N2_1 TaxID=3240774 RepID=UPI003F8CBD50
MDSIRPRRSALYMPASNLKAIEKARGLPTDIVILDLEDAVAPDAKAAAREAAVAAVRAGGFGRREVVIRTNGLDSPWGAEDLAAAVSAGPDAILVPKVNDAADVANYDHAISQAPQKTRLWCMIETAKAAFHLWELATCASTTRLSAWVLGVNDLAKETRAIQTASREAFLPILSLAVAAAHANGLIVLDGVHNEVDDLDALESTCRQSVELGFDGKSLIHPKHLDICNSAFSPSDAEIEWSKRIIAAFDLPENAGKGVLRIENRMVERLHLLQAERVVAIGRSLS